MKIETISRPWQKKASHGTRYNPNPFYHSQEWKRIRAIKLQQSPYCECDKCNGKKIIANTVDHITPISLGGSPTDTNNLMSMTSSCHNAKSAREKNVKYKRP